MRKILLGLIGLLFLVGCGKPIWVHSFKTQDQLNRDKWDCEQELAARCQQNQNIFIGKTGLLGLIASRKSCSPDDNDIERCLQLKHGWEKKKVSDKDKAIEKK